MAIRELDWGTTWIVISQQKKFCQTQENRMAHSADMYKRTFGHSKPRGDR